MRTAKADWRTGARSAIFIVMGLSLGASSCDIGLKDAAETAAVSIQRASNDIDIAISELQVESANWQDTLRELQSKLTGDARKLINNDIQNLITRTVNHAGVEFRCNGDFINQRVAETLQAIKAKLLGRAPPALEPRFCSAIPEAVDMKLVPGDVNKVTFYGYNFDNNAGFNLKLQDIDGAVRDVPQAISIPTAYAMILTLGPSGVTLNGNSSRLQLFWKDKLVSTVGIIQPQPVVNICESKPVRVPVQQVGPLIPGKVGSGDNEFNGNGPTVYLTGSVTRTPREATLRLYFDAKETKKDWTEVAGPLHATVYRAPDGWRIDRIASATSVSFGPVTAAEDDHWRAKTFELGSGGLLSQIAVNGDTRGDDVGKTGLAWAKLNEMQVIITQTGDCVSPLALNDLLNTRFLSQEVKTRISSRVTADARRLTQLSRIPGR